MGTGNVKGSGIGGRPLNITCPLFLLAAWLAVASPALSQTDFTGQWAPLYHEDTIERVPGPELGDYTGLPLTAAARLRADSWDADRISVVHWGQVIARGTPAELRQNPWVQRSNLGRLQ